MTTKEHPLTTETMVGAPTTSIPTAQVQETMRHLLDSQPPVAGGSGREECPWWCDTRARHGLAPAFADCHWRVVGSLPMSQDPDRDLETGHMFYMGIDVGIVENLVRQGGARGPLIQIAIEENNEYLRFTLSEAVLLAQNLLRAVGVVADVKALVGGSR